MVINDLAMRVRSLFPAARIDADSTIRLVDHSDGQGPRIERWDYALGPQPTESELLAVDLIDYHKARRCATVDVRTQELVAAGFPFAGERFSLSSQAQLNWTALFAARDQLTYPVNVTTGDDHQYSVVDAAAMANLCLTALVVVRGYLDSGRSLKLAILAAGNTAAVDAVVDSR